MSETGRRVEVREEEIEITPLMIEAGMEQFLMYSPREDSFEFAEEVVSNIYRAMLLRAHKSMSVERS